MSICNNFNSTAASTSRAASNRASWLTGRAAVLVLVLVVLAVSYASSMRAYLEQRAHLAALEADIAESRDNIEQLRLSRELATIRHDVEMQALPSTWLDWASARDERRKTGDEA